MLLDPSKISNKRGQTQYSLKLDKQNFRSPYKKPSLKRCGCCHLILFNYFFNCNVHENNHINYPPSLTQFRFRLGSLVGRRKQQLDFDSQRAGPTNRQLQPGWQRQRQLYLELHNKIHKISNVWTSINTIDT